MRKAVLLIPLLTVSLAANAQGRHHSIGIPKDSLSSHLSETHSIQIVGEDRMNKGLVTNSLNALTGQAAGVTVSTNGADRLAMLSSVRVRGTTSLTGGNEPLVIIDGVYSDLSTLTGIYPADIESFSILKNAAETAPFGSRGASGVIVVTTKKGQSSQFHISYDTNLGFESVYKQLDMLNATDYLNTAKSLGVTSFTNGGNNTNFQKAITRTGFVQNHHVAFSGGTEKSNYRASVGFMDHNTVVKINKYQMFTAKLDLQQKAFDDLLTIDLGIFGSTLNNDYINDQQKLFYSAAAQNPTLSFDKVGNGWERNTNASQINPPGALLENKEHERNHTMNTHIGLDFDLSSLVFKKNEDGKTDGSLHIKAFGSFSNTNNNTYEFLPTWTSGDGSLYRKSEKREDWLGNIQINYKNHWGAHALSATALTEYQRTQRSGFWTTVKGITDNSMGYNNLSAGATIPFGSTGSDYETPSQLSFLGMVEYTLLDTYTLSASLRADGSSLFGKNNRWGIFPSISGSWDILKSFNIPYFSILKLRTGYGLSGNSGGISSYNTIALLKPSGLVPWDGSQQVTFAPLSNVNPDLKWETRSSFNIGMDMGLWNNRLLLTAEYYYSKTRDMLYEYQVPVPPFPYDKWVANLGQMSNQGVEFGLGITPIQRKDMELNINLNMSFPKNKLISLSGDYNGIHMQAADISALGALDGAGFHGETDIVYQIVGQPLDSLRQKMALTITTSTTMTS